MTIALETIPASRGPSLALRYALREMRGGLSGFYVQFFNGLIIILSLLGHRWNQVRYR